MTWYGERDAGATAKRYEFSLFVYDGPARVKNGTAFTLVHNL